MKKVIYSIIFILASIGAIKYGVLGLYNIDYVATIFGHDSMTARVIYAILGLSGIIALILSIKWLCCCNKKC